MVTKRRTSRNRRASWQATAGRQGRGRFWAAVLLLLAVAAGAAYLMLFSPVFWVKQVKVEGVRTLSAEELRSRVSDETRQRFGPIETRSIFLADERAIADTLAKDIPEISDVEVTRRFPGTLVLSVTERRSTLLWQSGGSGYLVDQRGVAYERAEPRDDLLTVEDSTDLPVKVGEQVVGGGFITTLEEIRQFMRERGFAVTGFEIPETTFEVRAMTGQGWYALFDTTRAIEPQADALRLAVPRERPTQYADLRVPGRVYVR